MTTPAIVDSLFAQQLEYVGIVRDASFRYLSHSSSWGDSGVVKLACNVLAARTSRGLLLFDPGPGSPAAWRCELDEECARMEFFETGGLMRFLAANGGPDAVADIVLTHLHVDHCLALFAGDAGRCRVFPRARVWSSSPESLGRMCTEYDAPYEVCDLSDLRAVWRMFVHGAHSDRHTVILAPFPDSTIVLWGDYLPTSTHLRPHFRRLIFADEELPEFYEPLMLESAARNWGNLLYHDPRRPLVKIHREPNGFGWSV
ncbi:MAG: MBL fold metallo-hydrolase [Candidatus Brocadiia bacterium]